MRMDLHDGFNLVHVYLFIRILIYDLSCFGTGYDFNPTSCVFSIPEPEIWMDLSEKLYICTCISLCY